MNEVFVSVKRTLTIYLGSLGHARLPTPDEAMSQQVNAEANVSSGELHNGDSGCHQGDWRSPTSAQLSPALFPARRSSENAGTPNRDLFTAINATRCQQGRSQIGHPLNHLTFPFIILWLGHASSICLSLISPRVIIVYISKALWGMIWVKVDETKVK